MTTVPIVSTTGYVIDAAAGNNKFYRIIAAGEFAIFQYGSNKYGPESSTFAVKEHPTHAAAVAACDKQQTKKARSSGYDDWQTVRFDMDETKLRWAISDPKDKPSIAVLANTITAKMLAEGFRLPDGKAASTGGVFDPGGASDAGTLGDLEAFAERALNAITVAVTDPAAAAVAYAQIQEQWGEVEEQITAARSFLSTLETLVIETARN